MDSLSDRNGIQFLISLFNFLLDPLRIALFTQMAKPFGSYRSHKPTPLMMIISHLNRHF